MNSPKHPHYPGHHSRQTTSNISTLGAAVLGANDGIVEIAGIVVGVAGASDSHAFIVTAGITGLVAGALSMGVGQYIAVSSQRDTQQSMLRDERTLLKLFPRQERAELALLYQAKGLSPETAKLVADELSTNDAAAAHFDAELGIEPHDLNNPRRAAAAATGSFIIGGAVPLTVIVFASVANRLLATFLAVGATLLVTGLLSARATRSSPLVVGFRVVSGGLLCMIVTFAIGHFIGLIIHA